MEIIILGAGYAAIFAAANICRHTGIKVTLVDKNPYHQLLQQIHTVAAGIKKPEDITFSIKELFHDELTFVQGPVQSMDLINKNVYIDKVGNDDSAKIKYDYLVIALGSSNYYYDISGAHHFRSVSDALKLNKAFDSLDSGSTITICGCGATGASLAGALTDSNDIDRRIKIKIVEAQNNILPGWDKRNISIVFLMNYNSNIII
jgi:NADH:ubiquinone reductase (H+-translocating)